MSQTTDFTTQSNSTDELSADERSRLLADDRRRTTLRVLADRESPLSLSALTDAVVDRTDEPIDSTEVAISLHHVHLPKLAASDLVDYDPTANRVTDVRVDPAFFDQ